MYYVCNEGGYLILGILHTGGYGEEEWGSLRIIYNFGIHIFPIYCIWLHYLNMAVQTFQLTNIRFNKNKKCPIVDDFS